MSYILALLPPLPLPSSHTNTILKLKNDHPIPNHRPKFLPNLLSLALTLTLSTSSLPSYAIPSLNSSQPPSISLTTPFSQSKTLQVGLENGKIRPCPSINPGCVSTNPKSSSFSFPWMIPADSFDNAIQRLREAILNTQKNVKFQPVEDTLDGKLQHTLFSSRSTTNIIVVAVVVCTDMAGSRLIGI